jgi:predicted MPP superfamily phosphohydrolase
MTTEIIKKNVCKYNKIYHISDIHIRNTEEHVKIYQHVFANLYKYLLDVKSDKSLIVITGDILHNKDKLTTTCETLCVDFILFIYWKQLDAFRKDSINMFLNLNLFVIYVTH